jgi:beta-glucanase (GH16 family)
MYQTYHYRPGLPYNQSRNTSWTTLNNPGLNGTGPVLAFNRDYHTFGLDWQPDRLAFYIDGIECGVFPNKGTNNENIPNSEGYILIQQMVENSWIRSTGILLPNLTVSETFNIDYVRVWQGSTAPAGINGGNHRRTEQYRVEVSPNPMRGPGRL